MAQSVFFRISKSLLMIETAEKVAERHFFGSLTLYIPLNPKAC